MMSLNLKNKTALVLSGTKGIGYGVSYLLNQYGCKTIITSSSVKNLANVKKIMKKNCVTIVLNIKSNKSVKNFVKKIKK
jgi:short-subunit dehydrogenase involved in D-alanine esterification of teichoic acids